jgi:hypothetical protein
METPGKRYVFIAALGFFLLTHGGHFYSCDNDVAFATAEMVLMHGSFVIQPGFAPDLALAVGKGGLHYDYHPVGLSLLFVPLVAVGKTLDHEFPDGFYPAIVRSNVSVLYPENFGVFAATLLGPLCAAIGATMFWSLAEMLGYSFKVRAWLTAILILGTQFWPAARDSFPQAAVVCCLLVAVRYAARWQRIGKLPMAVGYALALLVLVRPFDAALTAPLLAIYVGWSGRDNFVRFCTPILVAGVITMLLNISHFGSPLNFGGREFPGFRAPFWGGLYDLLLSFAHGVIWYSPPVIASLPALFLLGRRRLPEAALFSSLMVVYVLAYAKVGEPAGDWIEGLCWGPRYIFPMVPFIVLALGDLLALGGAAFGAVVGLGVVGLWVQLVGTAVDFQRSSVYFRDASGAPADVLKDSRFAQIIVQWHDLLAGRFPDWFPLRVYLDSGPRVALAYAAVPLVLLVWGLTGIWREHTGARSPS